MAADRSYKSTPRTRKGALTSFGSRTDIGCLRDHNEDSLVVTPPLLPSPTAWAATPQAKWRPR